MWPTKKPKLIKHRDVSDDGVSQYQKAISRYIKEMEEAVKQTQNTLGALGNVQSYASSNGAAGASGGSAGYSSSYPSYHWYSKTTQGATTTTPPPFDEETRPLSDGDSLAALITKVDEMEAKLEAAWELINELAAVIDEREES